MRRFHRNKKGKGNGGACGDVIIVAKNTPFGKACGKKNRPRMNFFTNYAFHSRKNMIRYKRFGFYPIDSAAFHGMRDARHRHRPFEHALHKDALKESGFLRKKACI